jgi:hypothetical protein
VEVSGGNGDYVTEHTRTAARGDWKLVKVKEETCALLLEEHTGTAAPALAI